MCYFLGLHSFQFERMRGRTHISMNLTENWRQGRGFLPSLWNSFPHPKLLGFFYYYFYLFYLKAPPLHSLIKCFPLHPDYELDSSSQTSCSMARWKSANTMHCKLISFPKEQEMEKRRETHSFTPNRAISAMSKSGFLFWLCCLSL